MMKNLDDLLETWESAVELGNNPTTEELCADCPELLNELRRQIKLLQSFTSQFGVSNSSNKNRQLSDAIANRAQAHKSLLETAELLKSSVSIAQSEKQKSDSLLRSNSQVVKVLTELSHQQTATFPDPTELYLESDRTLLEM